MDFCTTYWEAYRIYRRTNAMAAHDKRFYANSFHFEQEDFELDPFNAHGGLGKFYQLFGDQYLEIIDELNEV
jgi:hypothetical protein